LRPDLLAPTSITHSECLELIAKQFGLADWNTLSARIEGGGASVASSALHKLVTRNPSPKALTRGMRFPVVPLRDFVFFPQLVSSLLIGREKSIRAIEHAVAGDGRLLVVFQRNPVDENPSVAELYQMGVVVTVLQCTKAQNGNMLSWVQGEQRAKILRLRAALGLFRNNAMVQ
jgi:hypothetical protein